MEDLRANLADTTLTAPVDGVELDVKRLFLPGYVIETKCPECGKARELDLRKCYLSYPTSDGVTKLYVCCEGCYAEFYVPVVLRLSLELAEEPKPKADCSCSHLPNEHGPNGCREWFGDRNAGFKCSCEWDGKQA
jgi:hypothetical protein